MHTHLTREEYSNPGIDLSEQLKMSILEIFNETYKNDLQKLDLEMGLFGFFYPKEFILITALGQHSKPEENRTNFFVSIPYSLDFKNKEMLETVKKAVEALGLCLDDYFAGPEWNDYFDYWQELEVSKTKVHIKSNRENIKLTLLADQILRASESSTIA